MTLSHSLLEDSPSPPSSATSSLMTSNSPPKRASLLGSILYLSILRRDRSMPGTVSTSPSKEAEIWNALERPTWSLTMMGVLMAVPTRVLTMMSKSVSRGGARVADGDSPVDQAGVLLLQSLDGGTQGLDALHLNLLGVLIDVNILQLTTVGL